MHANPLEASEGATNRIGYGIIVIMKRIHTHTEVVDNKACGDRENVEFPVILHKLHKREMYS